LNPETLTSPQDIAAVWITAENTITADALTTAIFFTPIDVLQKHFTFAYILVYSDGSAYMSENFPGKLF
jgi:thiamine biosynthesis lipoprotein